MIHPKAKTEHRLWSLMKAQIKELQSE